MPRHLKQFDFDSIRERLTKNELVPAGTKPEHSLTSAFFFCTPSSSNTCVLDFIQPTWREPKMPQIPFSFNSHHNLAAHTLIFDFPSSESYSRTVNEGVKNNRAGTHDLILFSRGRVSQQVRDSWLLVCIHRLQF